jgi:hypothetical protein
MWRGSYHVTKEASRFILSWGSATSGFTVSRDRLPDGRAKRQILRAIDQARTCIPLRALLRILRLSASLLSYY